jgi:hypothetical protein
MMKKVSSVSMILCICILISLISFECGKRSEQDKREIMSGELQPNKEDIKTLIIDAKKIWKK